MKIVRVKSSATCNRTCWHARGASCRCLCGGRNHGALRRGVPGGREPVDGEDGGSYQLAVRMDGTEEGERSERT